MGDAIEKVTTSPARQLRSAVEMSRLAPFVDSFASIDQTNFSNTYISYYTWGTALGLGLDLTLRERTRRQGDARHVHACALGSFRPARRERAGICGDSVHARRSEEPCLARFGRCCVCRRNSSRDTWRVTTSSITPELLARAGILVKSNAGRAFAGALTLQDDPAGVRITADVPYGSPAYQAGLERGDLLVTMGGTRVDARGRVGEARRGAQARRAAARGLRAHGVRDVERRCGWSTIRGSSSCRSRRGRAVADGAQRRFRESVVESAARNSF